MTLQAAGARIEARALGRRFGSRPALRGIDLEIAARESFGLLGANGAGKTTFIRLVTGYLLPSEGEIRVDGLCPDRSAREVQARIGYVPETPWLYPELRVEGFLRFVAGLRGLSGARRRTAVEAAIESFGLADVARRLVGNLSKGYRQRVSLAQAFLHEPALVIVDEPTSGLDPLQREEVRGILARLRGERTILLCTHDLAEARALCERVAILRRGALVATGPAGELLGTDDPLSLFRDASPESPS